MHLSREQLHSIHSISFNRLYALLESSKEGLKTHDITLRQKTFGANKLTEKKEKPLILQFILQFNNFFSYLLLFGSGLSFVSEFLVPGQGSIYIAWALLVVTFLNGLFTFIQEFRAAQAMKSFKNLMTAETVVLRNGEKHTISSEELVPGDIVFLSEGDKITADARLIEQNNLKVDHSSLTGESEPQLRSLKATSKKILLSRNMVFSGTLVQSGSGLAIIVATGDNTQIGQIARTTNEVHSNVSHLQLQIAHFIKIISYIAIALGLIFFGLGLLVGNTFWGNLVFAIGIIVANVPEGLLPTVTMTLSLAAQRMAKKNVLVKNMDAIETLGSLTVICSDKTGTLTENNLHVHGIVLGDEFYKFDRAGKHILNNDGKNVRLRSLAGAVTFNDVLVLCNNSTYANHGKETFGDPTEICLKEYVSTFDNISYIERVHPRIKEIPFTSETKYMITSHEYDKSAKSYLKGAPEIVLDKCTHYFKNGKIHKLSAKLRSELLLHNKDFSHKGYRVLGCAVKDTTKKATDKELEKNTYCFYGMVVMRDPPRPEVPEAVAMCKKAGIKIIVISGDQGTTVASIAKQVGIVDDPHIITGDSLGKHTDDELKKIMSEKEVVFARALPADKLRIVSLLQEMGEIVAVTGDGVNDAPALRCADVGVAMGKAGTEVAKEAADLVLLDDNFSSIVAAIKSGRTVYDNIKNFITYILTSNTPEIVPFLLFVLFSFWNFPLALPTLLILAIDLGTDMLPAIGLGIESSSKDIMNRPPRKRGSKLLTWKMIARSYGFIGPLQTAFSYVVFFAILFEQGWTFGTELSFNDPLYYSAVAGFFSTIVITQIFNVFACRTVRTSVFTKGIFSNKFILLGIVSEIVLLLVIIFAPFASQTFSTAPYPLYYVLWMIGFGFIILFLEETRKYIYRKTGYLGLD